MERPADKANNEEEINGGNNPTAIAKVTEGVNTARVRLPFSCQGVLNLDSKH